MATGSTRTPNGVSSVQTDLAGIDVRRQQILRCTGLTIGYGDLAVARGLSIEIDRGEVLALIGPNGAGKTTLLATLAGEVDLLAGDVLFEDLPLRGPLHRRARHGLGYVPAERAIVSTLTVRDNLRIGSGSVDVALSHFPELVPLLSRRAGLCSGGEQQMLALARALAASPRLLLVDELSLGLAPIVANRVAEAVRAAALDGLAVLVVEQNLQRALAIADRFLVLRHGEVVLEANSNDFTDRLDELEQRLLVG